MDYGGDGENRSGQIGEILKEDVNDKTWETRYGGMRERGISPISLVCRRGKVAEVVFPEIENTRSERRIK